MAGGLCDKWNGSAEDRHGVAHADAAKGTDDIAHQSHQNADGNQGAGVGSGQNGSGSSTADVSQRGNTAGEHVQLEDLGGQQHQDAVDGQDDEAGQDPPCHALLQQLGEGGAGGD